MTETKTRGRKAGFRMSEAHRVKIQNSNILMALIKHVNGTQDMSPSQVTAGLGLLKKVMPDLNAITLSGDPGNPVETITRIELVAGTTDDAGDNDAHGAD